MRRFLKRLLPEPLARLAGDLRRAEAGARGQLLRLALFPIRTELPGSPTGAPRIVAVCHGNILRSPLAAMLLERAVSDGRLPAGTDVRSAGLHTRPGRPADPRGVAAAAAHGVDLAPHRSTPLDAELADTADLILVMDRVNQAEVLSRHPGSAGRVVLLGAFADPPAEIPDPYAGDLEAVRSAYRQVAGAIDRLVARLAAM